MISGKLVINIKRIIPVRIIIFASMALILAALFLTFGIRISSLSSPVQAADFPGWNAISTIYYDPAQDHSHNQYLQQAASELKNHLEMASSQSFTIDTSAPPASGIFLRIDPNLPELAGINREAFKLFTDSKGIHITGKSAVAVRHGAYTLLEKLGFRWYFNHPAWSVEPDSLKSLDLNEVQKPFFIERGFRNAVGELVAAQDGMAHQADWLRRNRVMSDVTYETRHNWGQFADEFEVAQQNPNAVCYKDDGTTPQQVLPDHQVVIDRAMSFARGYMDNGTSVHNVTDEVMIRMAVPISPPDGNQIWCNEWQVDPGDYDPQLVTDKVFGLTNRVAKMLQQEYPGKYASVLSYSWYPEVPSFQLEPNVYVEVTTFTRDSSLSLRERLEGFRDMGVLVGLYDYYDVWPWWHDRIPAPGKFESLLQTMYLAEDTDVDTFYVESSDNWGPKGRLYWMTAQLMWDPTLTIDSLLDDFYTHAFGPAKEPMKRYYTRFDNQEHTDRVYQLAFEDLDEALNLASGDPEVQERIRHVLYHTYFWWRWGNNIENDYSGFANPQDAKDLYSFLWRIKDLHIVTARLQIDKVETVLRNDFGLSDSQISSLEDSTAPSAAEARTWLNEALSSFDSDVVDPPRLNALDFRPFSVARSGLAELTRYTNVRGGPVEVLVPSQGSETIQATVAAEGWMEWIGPDGSVLHREDLTNLCIPGGGCTMSAQGKLYDLPAQSPGLYRLRVGGWSVVDVIDHPASVPGPTFGQNDHFDTYFYVPDGVPNLLVGAKDERGNASPTVNLTAPDGSTITFQGDEPLEEWHVQSPASGVWRIQVDIPSNLGGIFWLHGIPAMVWHDPQDLLVPEMDGSGDGGGSSPAPDSTVVFAQDAQAPVSQTASVPILISSIPEAGLAGYDLKITLSNPVAEISSVSMPDLGITEVTPISSLSVRVRAVNLSGLLSPGANDQLLATLRVNGLTEGTAQINIIVNSVDDASGNHLQLEVQPGVFTTLSAAPIVNIGTDVTVKLGQAFSRSGTIDYAGDGALTATVNYGDGSGTQPLDIKNP